MTAGGTAAFVAIGLTLAGVRARDGRVILLGTAFSTTTALLMVHGFATPGVVVAGMNGVIALAGGALDPRRRRAARPDRDSRPAPPEADRAAARPPGACWPSASSPSAPPRSPSRRSSRWCRRPAARRPIGLLVFGIGCLLVLAHRAVRTHTLTHRPADLLVVAGCAWLGVALFAQLWMGPGNVAFYGGHALEIGGIALIGIPTVLDLARVGASRPLVGDLTAVELVAAEEAYLGTRIRALLELLADRDASTEEHTRRVALLAARVAEELKLPACLRRDLAVGGLLHDVGKLSVPLEILQKPGPLDDAEFAEIRRHPDAGRKLLDELGGFPETVRRLVSDHHERLDGTGYPNGLKGDELPIETRILAVCDVYDALVSDRVYRAAWTPERALALLQEEAGTGYDPAVVQRARAHRHADRRRPVVGRRSRRARPPPGGPRRRASSAPDH